MLAKEIFILSSILITMLAHPLLGRAQNDVYVYVLVLDGLDLQTFKEALDSGGLPNIKRYFIKDGAFFEGVSLFPSASNTVYQAVVSGLFPGHAGIPYLTWFNRKTKRPINYFTPNGQRRLGRDILNLLTMLDEESSEDGLTPSTIFKMLGKDTLAIYSSFSGDANVRLPKNPLPALWAVFVKGKEEKLDEYAFHYLTRYISKENIPRFAMVGLYSSDALGHHFGRGSPRVIENLKAFDERLGRFISLLKEKGIFEKTYIILLADHGMHNTPSSKLDLPSMIRSIGLTPYPGKDYNAYVSHRGIASAQLYIRGKDGWEARPGIGEMMHYPTKKGYINIIEELVRKGEIRFVVARNGYHNVEVFSKDGHATITYSSAMGKRWYRYTDKDGDPLKIRGSNARGMIGRFFDQETWGERLRDHIYPDAVVQLAQIFEDGKSGDIFVIPEQDYVFYRKKAATHGAIYREDMEIPVLMRGPGVKGGGGYIRPTDLFVEIASWFGMKVDIDHTDAGWRYRSSPIRHPSSYSTMPLDKMEVLAKRLKKLEEIRERLAKAAEREFGMRRDILVGNLLVLEEQIGRTGEDLKGALQ